MLKRILRLTAHRLLAVLLIFGTLIIGPHISNSIELPYFGEASTSIEQSADAMANLSDSFEENVDLNISQQNQEESFDNYPDLGDDQVFPFVAGLDSYE